MLKVDFRSSTHLEINPYPHHFFLGSSVSFVKLVVRHVIKSSDFFGWEK